MRTEKFFKNSMIAVVAQILTVILQFVTRRVFVTYMDIELLGYESLFSNIFNLVSMAEMGIGNVIVYNLYREIADNNIDNIKKYVGVYKTLYRCVAVVITIIGIICIPFLPYLINGDISDEWSFILEIYGLQLIGVISGYFLSYRRTVFIADQKEYKCVLCDLVGRVAIQIIQIVVLTFTSDFILYLITKIVINILINLMVYMLSNKEYPYLKEKYNVSFKAIQSANIFKDTKNFIVHKLANTVFGGTDNIVVSSIMGIKATAIFGNYYIVQNSVISMFLYKAMNPLRASIGSLVYSGKSNDDQKKLFNLFNMISYFMASFIAISFLVLYQPFITLWLGSDYLLPFSFVIAQVIAIYLQVNFEIIYMYRSAYGEFEYDKKYMVLSAIINLLSSFLFVLKWGVTGVMMGTILGLLFIVYGRVKFVFRKFDFISIYQYIRKQIKYVIISIAEALMALWIASCMPTGIVGFILKCLVCVLVPNIINIILFRQTGEFKMVMLYMKKYFYSRSIISRLAKQRKM